MYNYCNFYIIIHNYNTFVHIQVYIPAHYSCCSVSNKMAVYNNNSTNKHLAVTIDTPSAIDDQN